MSDISKVSVNSIEYGIKDSVGRALIDAEAVARAADVADLKDDLSEISEVVGSETIDVYEYTPVELNLGAGSWTNNGVVFTQNNDGTISAVGTNTYTGGIIFGIRSSSAELTIPLTAGEKYRLTGCPAGGATSGGYSLTIRYASGGGALFRDIGEGVIFDVPKTTTYKIHITVAQGLTINKTFTPKLEKMTVVGHKTVDVLTAKDDVARDGKVDKQQGVENAGKVLVVGNDGLVGLADDTGSGLTNAIKNALLECFRHVVWTDDDDDYYTALEEALDVLPQRYLTVVYNPENHTVYTDDSLDTIIPYLTVTYYENSVATVLSSNDYSLSGTLTVGDNTITVSYSNLTCTFAVNAIDFYNVFTWIYDPDGESNMEISYTSMFDTVVTVSGTEHAYGVFTNSEPSNLDTNRRSLYVTRGKAPVRIGTNAATSVAKEGFYPIPVPATAHKLTFTPTPSTIQTSIYLGRYIGTDPSDLYQYERINFVENHVEGVQTETWTPEPDLFLWFFIRKDSQSSIFTENPKFVISFE